MIRNKVQAIRCQYSGRAVITPSGLPTTYLKPIGSEEELRQWLAERPADEIRLGINEIELPSTIYRAIQHEAEHHHEGQRDVNPHGGVQVWIQREPVLHRWGVLPVYAYKSEDTNTIRLPASLLEPLAGDFDGDEADIFTVAEDRSQFPNGLLPSAICLHNFRKVALFKPSKQYIYGLHLLQTNADVHDELQRDLKKLGVPLWPEGPFNNVKERLEDWLQKVTDQPFRNGRWWAVLEQYALLALAMNPGMDLHIPTGREELARMDVFQCGAAKKEVLGPDGELSNDDATRENEEKQLQMIKAILSGESVTLHQDGIDPIASILAKAQSLKQNFGGQIKRFVFESRTLDNRVVMAAQTLTEELTQSVLSVKTLNSPLPNYMEYRETIALRWLKPPKDHAARAPREPRCPTVRRIRDEIDANGVAAELDRGFPCESNGKVPLPDWLSWLGEPHTLVDLLSKDPKQLLLPLDDLRVRPFVVAIADVIDQEEPPRRSE